MVTQTKPATLFDRVVRKVRSEMTAGLRRVWEVAGVGSFSRVARDGLDQKLQAFLPSRGFFVEAGALDGFESSNTYFLERVHRWRGLLIEPNAHHAAACRRRRRRSHVVHAALTGPDQSGGTVDIVYGHDLTWVSGSYTGEELERREATLARYGYSAEKVSVPAITLSQLLDQFDCPIIDFLSLDVEGFEDVALSGLDLTRHRPKLARSNATRPRHSPGFSRGWTVTKWSIALPGMITCFVMRND